MLKTNKKENNDPNQDTKKKCLWQQQMPKSWRATKEMAPAGAELGN